MWGSHSFALLISLILNAGIKAEETHLNCPVLSAKGAPSISIAFQYNDYGGTYAGYPNLRLPGAVKDRVFFNSIMSNNEFKGLSLRDSDFLNIKQIDALDFKNRKNKFIAKLKNQVQSHPSLFANFNFSGHGLLAQPSNSLALLLPFPFLSAGVTHQLLNECQINPATKQSSQHDFYTDNIVKIKTDKNRIRQIRCADLILSTEDIKNIFQSRKIFGIIDSCNSAGIDKLKESGMEFAFAHSAQCHQSAYQTSYGSVFSEEIANALEDEKSDKNSDGRISLAEASEMAKLKILENQEKKLATIPSGISAQSEEKIKQKICLQNPGLSENGSTLLLRDMTLGLTPKNLDKVDPRKLH
ncbi:MAG: hypothetical protein KA116_02145 [Proteobacteria bacterium]|nr:hypothetical protein [Pseudomonadota bacterium]